MSGTIWLITEDENDVKVIREILKKKEIYIKIKWLKVEGGSGGISRLRNQLIKLIDTARVLKSAKDCIAVLHDLDAHKQPEREIYNQILNICKQTQVKHVVAHDEIESWLLSDAGLAKWLKIKHENWDEQKNPAEHLDSYLNSVHKINYRGRYRDEVLKHIDGNIVSPSFQKALRFLENAPCMQV